jgi:hypothetical protein
MDVLADRPYSTDRLVTHHEPTAVHLREVRRVEVAAADAAEFNVHNHLICSSAG